MKISKMNFFFIILSLLILFVLAAPVFNLFGEQFIIYYETFIETLTRTTTLEAIGISLLTAFVSVVVTVFLGVPLAFLLANKEFKGKGIVEGLIDLPMAIPYTAAGVALLAFFGSRGLFGSALEPVISFEGTIAGIILAMTFISAPYMINSAKEGFSSVDSKYGKVAKSLGASKWEAFKEVHLPLSLPHIFNGAVMTWARSISAFAAVVLLVGFDPPIAPALVYTRFYGQGFEQAMATAVALLLILLPTFAILRYLRGRLFDNY